MKAADPGAADDLDERRLELTSDQVGSVRWQVLSWTAFVVLLVARDAPWPLTAGWVALVLLLREWRVNWLVRLRDDRRRPIALRLRQARWSILLAGLPQGASALFMVWLDRPVDAILTMVLVSLTAGAVSTSALIPGAFALYGACVLLPTALVWAAALDGYGIGVALLTMMLFGVQNRFARNNRQTFEESFRIRRDNDALVRQLAEARDRAEAATLTKMRFLAAASHDLRQPVHALSMQSGALSLSPDAEDRRDIARSMAQSIAGLSELLDALLDISRLDAGTLRCEPRPVHLSRLVQVLAAGSRALAEAKGLRLELVCPEGVGVRTDPLLLERLLRNVIDNAIKYTDRGSIRLTLTSHADGPGISVRDTGRGIAARHQAQVFDEFFRIEDCGAEERGRGLGLGLAIVRRLAELLELRLTLESEPGLGTCVEIRFARQGLAEPLPEAPAAPEVAPAASLSGLRVLVVDDEEEVREATAALLRHLGCSVITADGIASAMAAAEPAPDLVLSDYRLRGDEDGITLVQQLSARLPGLSAVLVTGESDPDRLRQVQASGLPLLHKPVGADMLRSVIAALVQGQGQVQGNAAVPARTQGEEP